MSDSTCYTPVLRNDFEPTFDEAERKLVIEDAENCTPTLTLSPDNPSAGAVAFLQIDFKNQRHEGHECISLDIAATIALYEALGTLIEERLELEEECFI